jgi:hypothetical protein
MRKEPTNLTSLNSLIMFIELNPWNKPRTQEETNHFFSRKNDKFWTHFGEYGKTFLIIVLKIKIKTISDNT